MTTLQIRLPHGTTLLSGALTRFTSALTGIVDVFSEAQAMARAAHKRHPFIEW